LMPAPTSTSPGTASDDEDPGPPVPLPTSGITSGSVAIPSRGSANVSTQPAGLGLTVDGQPVATPYSALAVVGLIRQLGAPSPQGLVSLRTRERPTFELWKAAPGMTGLSGGLGNDGLNGGTGTDTCLQDSGRGTRLSCEA
jgi:hypothetical protein